MLEEGPAPETAAKPRGGSFGANVLKLSGGAAVAQAITILTLPILSRLFTPAAYGTWQVFSAVVLILSTIACLRYEMAVVLPEQDEEAANVLGLCLGVTLVLSALCGGVLLLGGRAFVEMLRAPGLSPYLWLIPLALFIHGLWRAASAWNTRVKRFGRQSVAQVAGSATTSALPITMAALGHSEAGVLVATWVLGWLVNMGVLASQVWRDTWDLFRRSVRWTFILACLKRYRKFPLVDTWGTLFNAVSWQLPPLLLSAFFSETVVGYYSPANRVILLPLTLLGNAIVPVFLQRAAEVRGRPEELGRTVEMLFRRLVALGLFPSILLMLGGKELFGVVLGPEWVEAGLYTQILAPWMFFLFISIPLSMLFTALERQEFSLIIQVLILGTRVGALVIGGWLNNVYLALAIWSASGVLVYGAMAVWNLLLAGIKPAVMGRVLLLHGLYSLPAVAVLLLLKLWGGASDWLVTGMMTALLGLYVVGILWRDVALRQYLLGLLRKRVRR